MVMDNKALRIIDGGANQLATARYWAERGYYPVPVGYREKRPTVTGWQNLRLTVTDLPKHFNTGPGNVGVLLGEPYGLSDVDLDSDESLNIFPSFAPDTGCVFGRPSKKNSHWLYHSDPAGESLAFKDPIDGKMLLELRCQGGRQTVVPRSTHKDTGEIIRFEPGKDHDPANVERSILTDAVVKTAAAALLARRWPAAGHGRHDTELALAGTLCRAGWVEDDAKQFCVLVYTNARDHDRSQVPRVQRAVEDTFKKFNEGQQEITGIPKLAALIDKGVVHTVLKWLGIGEQPEVVDAANWCEHLVLNRSGRPYAHEVNAIISLHDRAWEGVLAFNESAQRVEGLKPPPWDPGRAVPFAWSDSDDTLASAWMAQTGILVHTDIAGRAIQAHARNRPFHPIRDYFNSLRWDGVPRIDDWLTLYLGAEQSEYTRAIGARWLVSAVARVLKPGSKVDTMLILEGPQGSGKSSALRILAHPWFSDQISELGTKDSLMQTRGVLVIEFSELDVMAKSEASRIKAFLSTQEDHYRPPYGKQTIHVPRESVCAGTCNLTSYLKDETGGRRFWPVKTGRIDTDSLKRDRDQIWAESVFRYNAGAVWWLDTRDLNIAAEKEQAARYDHDPWQALIAAYLLDQDGVPKMESTTTTEILEGCLNKEKAFWTHLDKTRVGRCLRALGWTAKQKRLGDDRERRYYPAA